MPRLDKEFHEFEYSQNYKKMKEMKRQAQNIAKKDYGKIDRNERFGYFGNKNNYNSFNKNNTNNNNNNKDYKNNTFLGKKRYLE